MNKSDHRVVLAVLRKISRMVVASGHDSIVWSLAPRQAGDGPEGSRLIEAMGVQDALMYPLVGSAYEGNETRAAVMARSFVPAVMPALLNRQQP